MSCVDDPLPLPPETVAHRAADLCKVAETVATAEQKSRLTYIIGTEVPVPGGESSTLHEVHVTRPEDAASTLEMHYQAFCEAGLEEAFDRVIGLVVQPGVEFDHSNIVHYDPAQARGLSQYIESTPVVYEAHSTDYQTPGAYRALVKDHFAILKVGPALTFALREAIFALAAIEKELIVPEEQSQILEVIDQVMLDEPGYWKKYYRPAFTQSLIDIHFSLSDRIRYYWPNHRIRAAFTALTANLESASIPLGMLSQYLPKQFDRVLAGTLTPKPLPLIIDKIQDVLRDYAYGCVPERANKKEVSHA